MANPLCSKINGIAYGGDYNPEQWPEDIWKEDARLMNEAGVNLVSLGIFSWAALEPSQGKYEFDWLDKVMNLMEKSGIKVDLATATASPPPWFSKKYPDSLPVTADGTKLWPGSRQQYCPSNPDFRKLGAALVTQLAQRYRQHPALAMWHIGNEYGCHTPECYCDVSANAFQEWLRNKYGSVTVLNKAWETKFWSQHINDWSEIYPPRKAPATPNPTQQIDFKEFSSDELLECFLNERQILTKYCPEVPVTTNFMGFFKSADYWKWAKHEDLASMDSYPDPLDPTSTVEQAMTYDLTRSLGNATKDKGWLLMEQTSGQVNWRPRNALKRPGQMRALSYQALARGAEGIMFFQWRASKGGSEKFHSAMVPHIGTENSRIWTEVKALGNELRSLDAVLQSKTKADVAIMFDWRNWWGLEVDSKPSADLQMLEQLRSFYKPLYDLNVTADFVNPKSDLGRYKLLIVPNLYMADEEISARLDAFVGQGGALIMSFFSGIVDENDHVRLGGYPAPFRKLLGLRVTEFDPYAPKQTNQIATDDGNTASCDLWSDVIELEGAKAIATYNQDFYKGSPAVTRNQHGKGVAYYLGTRPEQKYMTSLIEKVCAEVNVETLSLPKQKIEIVEREADGERFSFIINHGSEKWTLKVNQDVLDLINGTRTSRSIVLEPFGVSILKSRVSDRGLKSLIRSNLTS